jgi:hypothetical protein
MGFKRLAPRPICKILHIRASGIDLQRQADEYWSSIDGSGDMELDRENSLEKMVASADETSTQSRLVLPTDKSTDVRDPPAPAYLSFGTGPVRDP